MSDRIWEVMEDALVVNGKRLYPLGPRTTPAIAKAFSFLAERGGRARLEEVMSVAMPLVPPGMAFRNNERQRLRRSSDVKPRWSGEEKMERAIRSGQRQKVMDSLYQFAQTGRLQIETDADGVRWVQLNVDWTPAPRGSRLSGNRT